MLPLGELWSGECRAVPGAPRTADHACCNMGYARGSCERFPEDAGPDAVRFSICRHEGEAVSIQYVLERDHLPFAHGRLEHPAVTESELLTRQARAYVESYLRRKKENRCKENR
jgi:hypothetical protein